MSEREARLPRTSTGTNLLGLLKHCAYIEAGYFGEVLGRPAGLAMPWAEPGTLFEDNADFFATADESMAEILEFCQACFDHADTVVEELPIDAPGAVPWWPEDCRVVPLGQIILHVAVDEARHAGHADILRENIDGAAGLRTVGDSVPGWPRER